MSCKGEVPFEEAENKKFKVKAWIGVTGALLGWFCRGSTTCLSIVATILTYLLTGDRYQWVYIWRKTVYRDYL